MEKKALTADEIQEVLMKMDNKLEELKTDWLVSQGDTTGFFSKFRLGSVRVTRGVQFIIKSLDHLIQYVEDLIPSGEDKKTAVIVLIGKLYDFSISQNLPIWLKPIGSIIKKLIIDIFFDNLIDFIVQKYNESVWGNPTETTPIEEPAKT